MDIIKIDRARVTKQGPELKTSKSGNQYVRFTVMWSSGRPDRSGQGFENGPTKFLNVTCFGELAQQVMQTVQPNTNVALVGKLEHFEWQGQNGPQDDWSMVADLVSPARVSQRQQGGQQGDPWNSAPPQQHQGGFSNQQAMDDEPPF